jgi:hypothetical protein
VSFFKDKPYRDKRYTDWVKSLDCCICDAPADDPHHIIGVGEGGTGTKACDLLTMPMCRPHHNEMHRNNMMQLEQWRHTSKTLQRAIKEKFNFK